MTRLHIVFFAIFNEVMAEGLDNINEGVNVGGELVTDGRFTDDQGMVAETEKGL